jgi:flagellar motor switch protein FliN
MIDNNEGSVSSAWASFGAGFAHTYDIRFTSNPSDGVGSSLRKRLGEFGSSDELDGAATDSRELLDEKKVKEIPLNVEVVIGRAQVPVAKLMSVAKGQVIRLDRHFGDPVEIRVNGQLVGHGEIVADDQDNFIGVRVISVLRD